MFNALYNITESSYLLSLNEGLMFAFYADKYMGGWLDNLADIMDLKPDNNGGHGRKVFCVRMDSTDEAISGTAGSPGWQTIYDYRLARIHHNREKDFYLVEIDNRGIRELEYISMWYALYAVYRSVIAQGGFPLHAGLAEVNGRGVIIAGRSGKGKSTSIRRISEFWPAFSDDETMIVHDKDRGYCAYPMPTWSEYIMMTGSNNKRPVSRPLDIGAVFFIEQSCTDEVIPIANQAEIAVLVNRSVKDIYMRYLNELTRQQRREEATAIFNNACAMAKAIPCYRLNISLTGRFWEKIEEVVKA